MTDEFFDDEDLSLSDQKDIAEEARNSLKAMAVKYLNQYFLDKVMFIGGKIPEQLLRSEKRISLVLNTTICDAVDLAYKKLLHFFPSETQLKRDELARDTRMVLSILKEISMARIPKELAGGMLLLHLEMIEGIPIEP